MSAFIYCELNYYKKILLGLISLVLIVFILNKIVDIHMYANAIYIASVFVITLNIVTTILKVIILFLGWKSYEDCSNLSISKKAAGWISSIL